MYRPRKPSASSAATRSCASPARRCPARMPPDAARGCGSATATASGARRGAARPQTGSGPPRTAVGNTRCWIATFARRPAVRRPGAPAAGPARNGSGGACVPSRPGSGRRQGLGPQRLVAPSRGRSRVRRPQRRHRSLRWRGRRRPAPRIPGRVSFWGPADRVAGYAGLTGNPADGGSVHATRGRAATISGPDTPGRLGCGRRAPWTVNRHRP